MKMVLGQGEFTLKADPTILVGEDVLNAGQHLAEWAGFSTGLQLTVKSIAEQDEHTDCIVLRTAADKRHLGPEGYHLRILKDRVLVEAAEPAGVFYGCQTIHQLLPSAATSRTCSSGTNVPGAKSG
jgi:hexosaminidase